MAIRSQPSGWLDTKWGDLATLEYGKSLRDYEPETSAEKPYRVFGTNGPIGWHSSHLCNKPSIVVGRKGAYRGIHFSPDPFFVIDTAFYLRPATEFDIRWAYYQLKNFDINKLDSGSAIPSTSRDAFYEIPVALPPLPIQRRIAGILSAYDELIENSQRRIKILESMARALYREWFVHFRFPGHESVPRVPSPLGEIPQGWACVRLADVGELTVGGDWGKDAPEGNDWVEVGCLRGVDLHAFAKAGFSEVPVRWIKRASLDKRRVAPVDVLVEGSGECGRSLAGSDQLEGLIGHPVVYSNFCKRVRLRDAVTARYVEHMLNSMVANGEMTQYRTGTTIPNLNMSALFEAHQFLLPPADLLRHFVGLLASSDAFKFSGRIQNLRRTRDLLLPRLLSGQIDMETIS